MKKDIVDRLIKQESELDEEALYTVDPKLILEAAEYIKHLREMLRDRESCKDYEI